MSVLVTSPCIAVRTVGWCGSSLWMKDHLELERVGAGRIADRCPVQNCMLHRTTVADLRRRTRCDLQVRLQSRRYELAHQVCFRHLKPKNKLDFHQLTLFPPWSC